MESHLSMEIAMDFNDALSLGLRFASAAKAPALAILLTTLASCGGQQIIAQQPPPEPIQPPNAILIASSSGAVIPAFAQTVSTDENSESEGCPLGVTETIITPAEIESLAFTSCTDVWTTVRTVAGVPHVETTASGIDVGWPWAGNNAEMERAFNPVVTGKTDSALNVPDVKHQGQDYLRHADLVRKDRFKYTMPDGTIVPASHLELSRKASGSDSKYEITMGEFYVATPKGEKKIYVPLECESIYGDAVMLTYKVKYVQIPGLIRAKHEQYADLTMR
jgi:hypothetical protein